MLGARASLATRLYLATLGQVTAEPANFLVVDDPYLVSAKGTNLALGYVSILTEPAPGPSDFALSIRT
jgi:hypothetical protein